MHRVLNYLPAVSEKTYERNLMFLNKAFQIFINADYVTVYEKESINFFASVISLWTFQEALSQGDYKKAQSFFEKYNMYISIDILAFIRTTIEGELTSLNSVEDSPSFEYSYDDYITEEEYVLSFQHEKIPNESWIDMKEHRVRSYLLTHCTMNYFNMYKQCFMYLGWINLPHQSIKSTLKRIVGKMEETLKEREKTLLNNFVSFFPLKKLEKRSALDFSFYRIQDGLDPDNHYLRAKVVQCLFDAAMCFLNSSEGRALHVATVDNIIVISSKTLNATIYMDKDVDNPLLYPKVRLPLLYAIDSYKLLNEKNIIVYFYDFLSDINLSTADKQNMSNEINYFLGQRSNSFQSIIIEFFSYKSFFKNMPNERVDFFYNRLSNCISKYKWSVNSIGTLLENNEDFVIECFASSSNHYIGSKYIVDDSTDSFFRFLKVAMDAKDPITQTNEVTQLFEDLSQTATCNLKYLKEKNLFRFLFTSEWLYNNLGFTEGFDNTYVCVGYLKLIENLLSSILTKDYAIVASNYITRPDGNLIDVTKEENEQYLMLGNMISFFSNSPDSPIYKSKYNELFKTTINEWKQDVRNGYFHKDILSHQNVEDIRNKTLLVIYMILGLLPASKENEDT